MSTSEKLEEALRELATEMRALRSEMRSQRERKISTRRVKSARAAKQMQNVPVSDIAAAAARRALAKFGG